MSNKSLISISTEINADIKTVWNSYNNPVHIAKWNQATPDWQTTRTEIDLKVGGKFKHRMEAKDGSFKFDFEGSFTQVEPTKKLSYVLDDDRKVDIVFSENAGKTAVSINFEAENQNDLEMQKNGWQAILNSFKNFVENKPSFEVLNFEIEIDAPAEKVFETMLDDITYRKWTAAFHEGSYYEGKWQKGEKIYFIGPGENGQLGGMVSRVKELMPNEFVSIEHVGLYDNGKEVLTGEHVDKWKGGLENYFFYNKGNKTLVRIELETNADFAQMFSEMWPKALQSLKNLCEK